MFYISEHMVKELDLQDAVTTAVSNAVVTLGAARDAGHATVLD